MRLAKKAVCDGCGQEYGELGNHKFTETVSKMYLKSAATCQSPAVYYKSCLVCDEKSSETFEYGEKDFSNHIGNTYLVGQRKPPATQKAIPAILIALPAIMR